MNRKAMRFISLLLVLLMLVGVSLAPTMAQDNTPRGGTVSINLGPRGAWVQDFNPYAPNPADGTQTMLYEKLILWNPVEGGEPTYWLATAHSYSDDLLSLTFELREGVLWSDGEAFNADDVVFTFDMIKEFPAMDRLAILPFTESAEKIDDHTVRFNLSEVFTQADTLIGQLWIVPEHVWSEIEDPVTFTNPEPVTTGPFSELTNFSEQIYEFCRNENYWQEGKPYVDCIRFPAYTGNDPVNLALITDEVDWAGNFIPDIQTVYVDVDPDNHFYYFWPGGAVVQLYPNSTVAPFDDINLRRALSMAINYDDVVGIGMFDYTIPSNATGLGPRYESWWNQDALAHADTLGLNRFDPDAAMAALDAAGYVDADGDGWRDLPDGTPFEFQIQSVNGWSDWASVIQIISGNFQDVGLNAVVEFPDFGEWLNNLQTGDYQVSIGWSSAGRTPWDFYRNVLDSALIGEDGLANAQLWGRWTSEETTQLLNDFVATADLDEQREIVNQLQMAYVENSPAIPLFPGPTWYEWNTVRFTGFPTVDDYYTQGSPWDANSALITITTIHCKDDTSCGQ
jgi:peptide/nickel transport system substrate-binding protein